MKRKTIDLLIHSATQLCTVPAHNNAPQRGQKLGDLGIIPHGAIAIHNGYILETGTTADLLPRYNPQNSIDSSGHCLLPGFVDPHTHLPWVGDRANEFEQRIAGATYMEIMAAGGGIMSTVRQTRQATLEQLIAENLPRLQRMLSHGTTSIEAKTGYGLETQTELKQLEAIYQLNSQQPIEITPTFLPAHAIPTEYKGQTQAYVDHICQEMLPIANQWAKDHQLTLFCDVFCEAGVFDIHQTEQIFRRALELDFRLKLHADEFEGVGGTALAVKMGAVSVDHLVKTPPSDIQALGQSPTIAVSLPGTPFGLGHPHYTPAQAILAAGGALALATDCNPGTCWCENMQMIIALACRSLKLTPAQAIAAATINSAFAIARADQIGSLTAGKQADLLILHSPDYHHLGYRFGTNLVQTVIKRGKIVANNP